MSKTTKMSMSRDERAAIRNKFDELSTQWKEALRPIDDEKAIVFPEAKIPDKDHPSWPGPPGSTQLRIKLPIGPLESMFAMYYWYLFLGRHLLREEILELSRNLFPGMMKSESFFDKIIKKPAGGCKKVLESIDAENKHHLELRCDRWFKTYLSENPPARKRARHLVGFRGRVEDLTVKSPSIFGREIESWKLCIHYGVLNSCTDRDGAPLERGYAEAALSYHYNNGPGGPSTLTSSITKVSKTLDDKNDPITKALAPLYKEYEGLWMDKAQDMVHEYEEDTYERPARKIEGRNLVVPSELRALLDLKHSHITLNSEDAGALIEIFKQSQKSGRERSSKVPSDHSNRLAPSRLGPETAPEVAGSSTPARTISSYPFLDSIAQSQRPQQLHFDSSGQSLRTGYETQYSRPSLGDPVSAATTGMGNLSVAAPAPAPGQDEGGVKRKDKKHHSKKHDRSRTPPKETRPGKRQTGEEARQQMPQLPSGRGKR